MEKKKAAVLLKKALRTFWERISFKNFRIQSYKFIKIVIFDKYFSATLFARNNDWVFFILHNNYVQSSS